MNKVYPNGNDQFTVKAGTLVSVIHTGDGEAKVTRSTSFTNQPGVFVPVGTVSNGSKDFLITADATVRIDAGPDPVFYTTSKPLMPDFVAPEPHEAHVYFEDFDYLAQGDWTTTETSVGAGTGAAALADGDGGIIVITNAANDDDNTFLQKKGESFRFAAGKKLWFEARFKVSDATESDVVMGLQITDTTPLDVSDGVFFIKADGATTFSGMVEKNNTATTTASVATLADDTYITLGFFYNGVDAVRYFVNRAYVSSSVVTNLPDDEDLTISFGVQNGEAAVKTMTIDYIMVAKER